MSYKLSVKAEEDLIHAYREGVRMFGTEQAEKYYVGLERVFRFLSDTPKAARERTEITPPVRVHPYRSHIIVYLINDKGNILILRIRHGREDWESAPG
ncbi:MAG: type II toxin-antitoxin system RelE/ParE family toxin [Alphaproteobacteria bacterium]|nr:type II toxin-antitoxin system RelE/ParE family toxin [Alphaproteobacteria bacterium]